MYRVSATTLEKFRRFMMEVSPYDTEASLIETLRGLFKGNDKTKIGGAFHKIIEGDYAKQGQMVLADEILFTSRQAAVALNFRKEHNLMIHEVDLHKVYETAYGPMQISGRLDGLEGIQVHDHKCKFRNPDWEEYLDSIQWRIYLDAMDVDVFWYNVFEVKGFVELVGTKPFFLGEDVQFIPHEPLKCTRYLDMEKDIQSLLNSFMEYIHNRGFLHYLKEAKQVVALYD